MLESIRQERLTDVSENGGSELQTESGDILTLIDLELVPLNVQLGFPIFLAKARGRGCIFTLIRNRGTALSARVRDQLRQENGRIYTKAKYIEVYKKSVDQHFEEFLTDESVPMEKRLTVLHEKGERIMKQFFARPDSQQTYEQSQELVSNVVRLTLSNGLCAQTMIKMARKDYETYTHSLQVCILGVGFSQKLFSDPEILQKYSFSGDLEKVGRGFICHDLGKSLIDSKILKKDGPLTPAEWQTIRRHPLDGAQLLRELGIRDRDILHITLYHHERMNGTGYPHGLSGIEIPSIARVAAIADAFDAITTRRPYKRAINTFSALKIMRDENAGFYDPDLFQSFVRMFGRQANPSEPDTTEQSD